MKQIKGTSSSPQIVHDKDNINYARHELRSPVAIIRGVLELMRDSDTGVVCEKLEKYLIRIEKAADLMEEKIDEFFPQHLADDLHLESEHEIIEESTTQSLDYQYEGQPKSVVESNSDHSKHILLVEDNEINLEVIIELLEKFQVGVSVARHGKEAIHKLKLQKVDFVFMDIEMPVMGGLETTAVLRSESDYANIPIIGLTAHKSEEVKQQCLSVGMNGCLVKPVNLKEMAAVLNYWLGIKKSEEMIENTAASAPESKKISKNVLNIENGMRIVANNHDLYLDLLERFEKKNKDFITNLWELLDFDKTEEAVRLAHNLKSESGNLGANTLYELAGRLEHAIKINEFEDVVALIDELRPALAELLVSIDNYVGQLNLNTLEKNSIDDIQVLDLISLISFNIEDDISATFDDLAKLQSISKGTEVESLVMELTEAVANFNTELSLQLLQRLSAHYTLDE